MVTLLICVFFCYLAIGLLLAIDYLLRLHFFNQAHGESWDSYIGLPQECLAMSLAWPKYLKSNINAHYNRYN